MASNPVPLSPNAHKGIKIKQNGNVEHLSNNHIAAVLVTEYLQAGHDYPIVFIKEPQTQEFNSVVIWGIEPGENLFVNDDQWTGGFLPAASRSYPFVTQLSKDDSERLFIGIFEEATSVNKEEGELIFNDDGSETEWMANIKAFLVNIFEQGQATKNLLKELDSLGLLVPQSLSVELPNGGDKKSIDGFFIIDREKLNALSDEQFLELRKSNKLDYIYAHLASLKNIEKLVIRKAGESTTK